MAWQHHEHNCTDDQLFAVAARVAMEDVKKRSDDMKAAVDIPDFIKVKRKGKGETRKWYEGPNVGMIFKKR